MREGEVARAAVHWRLGFGDGGDAAAAVPPFAFLEYEVSLLRVSPIQLLEGGKLRVKSLRHPEYLGCPEAGDEVELFWRGDLLQVHA